MLDYAIAHGLHVMAVVLWIGGLAFVTLVTIPSLRREPPAERLSHFARTEGGFAPQAKLWVLLAGASGFWMIWRGELWSRFTDAAFWWMHAMLAVWLAFMAMLFVLEPLFIHRRMTNSPTPEADFALLRRMHLLLLTASLITVFGAAAGSHGFVW